MGCNCDNKNSDFQKRLRQNQDPQESQKDKNKKLIETPDNELDNPQLEVKIRLLSKIEKDKLHVQMKKAKKEADRQRKNSRK